MKQLLKRSVLLLLLIPFTGNAAEGGGSSSVIEEVVVTATKKSTAESAQDVPIAVAAFNGETIEAAKMVQLSDLQVWVPNVRLVPQVTFPGATQFRVRGQGTGSSIPSDDPPVGVFQDGITMGVLHGSNLDPFDLEAVEILRGPQGTLFGRNVSAGAIVARTRRADFETSGDIAVTAGSHGRFDVSARVTGPLIDDTLAGKITVLSKSHDGYYDNKYNAQTGPSGPVTSIQGKSVNSASSDYGESESLLVRPSLRWTPTDNATIDVIAEWGDTDGDGQAWRAIVSPFGAPLPSGDQDVIAQHNGLNEVLVRSLIVDANFDGENGTWTSITGYRSYDQRLLFDVEGTGLGVFDFNIKLNQEQLSQELRWSGTPFDNDIELTLGAYYFEQEIDYLEGRWIFGGAVVQGLGGYVEHESRAVFGNISVPFTDKLRVDLGLRYTDEEKETDQVVGQASGFCDLAIHVCTTNFSGDADWSNVTPSLTATYHINDDMMIWGSYKKGFRSGGFNLRHLNPTTAPAYDEEEANSFEIGLKSDLTETLRVNASVFHTEYDDMQVVRLLNDQSQQTVNAAKATSIGLDLELSWLLTENFSIRLNAGVMDTEFDELDQGVIDGFNDTRATTIIPGNFPPLTSPSDFQLPAPEETVGLTFLWDVPLSGGAYLTFRGSASYESSFEDEEKIWEYDSTTMVNAGIVYTSADEKWSATVYGTNITDEEYVPTMVATSVGAVLPVTPGRRWAVEVSYSF